MSCKCYSIAFKLRAAAVAESQVRELVRASASLTVS